MVDEGQIGQVVRNLVLNAREATPEGGVVSIRAENVGQRTRGMPALPPGRYVRVTIADRGVGMSPELLAKIFDPYFSTKRRGDQKGMGLGLTICHAIIQRHGGAIAVKSAPGEGTAFDLYLPAAALAVEDAKAAGPRGNPQRRKLLVMDDEEPVRELCGKALQMMGHEVELVENGQSALDTYGMARKQGRPFDAVFLDLTIRNGLGGRETILALRQIEPCVKAVVMSGYAGDPVMEEHVRHGFAGALVKPFGIEKLRNVLSQVLGNK
jgi:CheY-like chemotaxis protein